MYICVYMFTCTYKNMSVYAFNVLHRYIEKCVQVCIHICDINVYTYTYQYRCKN